MQILMLVLYRSYCKASECIQVDSSKKRTFIMVGLTPGFPSYGPQHNHGTVPLGSGHSIVMWAALIIKALIISIDYQSANFRWHGTKI